MSTNLQTALTDPSITAHIPVRVIEIAIEDEEMWEIRKVSGTVRVTEEGQTSYWYKGRRIERDDSEYADDRGYRSHDKFRCGRNSFTSLTEAKQHIDSRA